MGRNSMKQYQFRDAEFMSAREKEIVLETWVRFLRGGLRFLSQFERRGECRSVESG